MFYSLLYGTRSSLFLPIIFKTFQTEQLARNFMFFICHFFHPFPAKVGVPLSLQVAPLFPCQFLTAGESLPCWEKNVKIINYTAALPEALHIKWEWTN